MCCFRYINALGTVFVTLYTISAAIVLNRVISVMFGMLMKDRFRFLVLISFVFRALYDIFTVKIRLRLHSDAFG